MNNSIMIIHPYWKHNTWCFSDEVTGLVDEPFVAGADIVISLLVASKGVLVDAKKGVTIIFSDGEFPDYDIVANHTGEYGSGNTYETMIDGEMRALWLCPALLRYLNPAPKQIYVKVTL